MTSVVVSDGGKFPVVVAVAARSLCDAEPVTVAVGLFVPSGEVAAPVASPAVVATPVVRFVVVGVVVLVVDGGVWVVSVSLFVAVDVTLLMLVALSLLLV